MFGLRDSKKGEQPQKAAQTQSIGIFWIIAMIALLMLLVLGIFLYLRMSVPVEKTEKKAQVQLLSHSYNTTGGNDAKHRQNGYHRN